MQIDPNSVQWDDAPTPVRTAPAPSFPGVIRGAPETVAPREPKTTFRTLTPDEVAARGLPPGSYQISSEGKVDKVGGDTGAANASEGERNNKAFYERAARALDVYDKKGLGPRSFAGQAVAALPGGETILRGLPDAVGDSPDRQITEQAKKDFVTMILRSDSGANAPEAEVMRAIGTYFPSAGETDPTVIENYANARIEALNGLKEKAGRLSADIPDYTKNSSDAQPVAPQQVAITGGESYSTDQDKAIAAAVNGAFQKGGGVQELTAAAEAAGAQVRPDDIATFQKAIEARDKKQAVNFATRKSGRRSPIAQVAGEALMTPFGTAVTGAVNAAGLGALSLFAGDQVQGLEALNPKSAFVGEAIGSAIGTGALAAGARQGIGRVSSTLAERMAGGGLKGALARTAATDAAYGGIYAANTGEDIGTGVALGALGSLVGAGVGAGVKRAAPAFRGMFRTGGDDFGRMVDGGAGGGAPPSPVTRSAGDAVTPDAGNLGGQADEPFVPRTVRSNDAGASGTGSETFRRTQAESLPVPVELTRGAASRDAEQLAFEKEQIFGPLGQPLRTRAQENNTDVLQNFDRFVDMADAKMPDLASTGNAVTKALSQGYKAAKGRVEVAYKRAEAAGHMAEPISYKEISDFIGEQTPTTREKLAPVMNAVSEQLRKLDPEGTGEVPLNALEEVRKMINQLTEAGTANGNMGGELKGMIDAATEGKGGALYKKARALRIEQARKFENRAVVERLVANVKNKADAKTESNKVFEKSILNESPEDIKFLRHALKTSGPDGRQAWRELQGATIRHIENQATNNVNLSADNEKIVSAAQLNRVVKELDDSGRLDVIFDPATATRIRDLRDVVQYVNTVPPGTSINNSGTARTLAALMAEMTLTSGANYAFFGSAMPVPLVSGIKILKAGVRDNRIKKKIAQSLMPRSE